MPSIFSIGPKIGVARLGNSPDAFYLEPDMTGARPIECDPKGNILFEEHKPKRVRNFKDGSGRVKRQGAYFRIFEIFEDHTHQELTLQTPGVKAIVWTVHIANKKACWFNFKGLEGNLLYGPGNSYTARHIPKRNANTPRPRRELIIDPGPRSISGPGAHVPINEATSGGYKFASWPGPVTSGVRITSLGDLHTDDAGRLIVLGGHGDTGGDESITSFAGADTWHDDISDGPVECHVERTDGSVVSLSAWCIVGSPKFAPEIVNIVTLDDTMHDVAVRDLGANPAMFRGGAFVPTYEPDYDREILPILTRPAAYRWVANTPSMNSLSPPPFDAKDKSAATQPLRQAYLDLFRVPSPQSSIGPAANQLFSPGMFPMMPLNSGSNSVFDDPGAPGLIDKFLTVTETQYFVLHQWAKGLFNTGAAAKVDIVTALTAGSMGNCVGGPFCPGIEVTWSLRNPNVYDGASHIRPRHPIAWYDEHGLNPDEDETDGAFGCEPGDLTKRMAIPWQADFFQCSIQFINFTDPHSNKEGSIPKPPTYYAYWWPPQSPWQVLTSDLTTRTQTLAGTPAGYQVPYARGINTFGQMIDNWHYMGFVANQNTSAFADYFPYLVEQERNHSAFVAAAVAVGDASNVITGDDTNFSNTWFIVPPPPPLETTPTAEVATHSHRRAGEAVTFATSRRHGRRPD